VIGGALARSLRRRRRARATPIIGYEAIAAAASARLKRSVCVRTAKRWAKAARGWRPRLPVLVYPNGRAYLLPAHLEVFAVAWEAHRPSGAREPGRLAA
jgi:hypothetical protein